MNRQRPEVTMPHLFPAPGVSLSRPSNARVYDYLLGGTTHWAMDRALGEALLELLPRLRRISLANRDFLRRVVRHLTALGIRQFLDVGCGLPTLGCTHEFADSVRPGESRVVYVDHDPVVVAHSQLHIERTGNPARHAVLHADLRSPDRLWRQVADTGVLDLTEPVALLLIAVLDLPAPEDGSEVGTSVLARYRELLPGGSFLAVSHAAADGHQTCSPADFARAAELFAVTGAVVRPRASADIAGLFGDFDLLSPGLTWAPLWRPGPGEPLFRAASESSVQAGVGRKGWQHPGAAPF